MINCHPACPDECRGSKAKEDLNLQNSNCNYLNNTPNLDSKKSHNNMGFFILIPIPSLIELFIPLTNFRFKIEIGHLFTNFH